jgi:hypothetical protein
MPRILPAIFAALAAAPVAMGHSWSGQLRNINDKGEYVGDYGYPRGMIAAGDPGFNDEIMVWRLPTAQGKVFIDETTPLCKPDQTKPVQSQKKYPRLQSAPGTWVAIRYTENGHVTEPSPADIGKPEDGKGTVFVYGTTEPTEDETLLTVLQWTKDGKGGNGKGVLLATNDFDDGRCYELNSTPEMKVRSKEVPNFASGQVSDGPGNFALMCETNVQLPKTLDKGKPYTMYWVWQWNSSPVPEKNFKGKDEYYTTCMDIDMVSNDAAQAADASGVVSKNALPQQDAMSVAVSNFKSRTAVVDNVIEGEIGPIFSDINSGTPSTPTSTANAGPSASASAKPSRAPTPSGRPAKSSKAPGQPGIPTLTGRPGASPTSQAASGLVTVTDTVYVTVTAGAPDASQSPAVITSKRGVSSVKPKPSPSGFTSRVSRAPRPSGVPTGSPQSPNSAQPSRLPGFDMRPPGAKFRGRFTR